MRGAASFCLIAIARWAAAADAADYFAAPSASSTRPFAPAAEKAISDATCFLDFLSLQRARRMLLPHTTTYTATPKMRQARHFRAARPHARRIAAPIRLITFSRRLSRHTAILRVAPAMLTGRDDERASPSPAFQPADKPPPFLFERAASQRIRAFSHMRPPKRRGTLLDECLAIYTPGPVPAPTLCKYFQAICQTPRLEMTASASHTP